MNIVKVLNLVLFSNWERRAFRNYNLMAGKFWGEKDLENLTKEQLISKVVHYQNLYRQVLKQNEESPTKFNQLLKRAATVSKRKRKNKEKEVNFKDCMYRRIAFKVAYLGWDYDGLQENENSDTIEKMLRKAFRLTKLAAEDDPLRFSRSGRTDKGVSAFQQVITVHLRTRLKSGPGVHPWFNPLLFRKDDRMNKDLNNSPDHDDSSTMNMSAEDISEQSYFKRDEQSHEPAVPLITTDVAKNGTDLECNVITQQKEQSAEIDPTSNKVETQVDMNEFDYVMMMNRVLPSDIRVLGWMPIVDETFSARHNCLGREYHYFFPRGKLNIQKMQEGAALLCGVNDFRNFSKVDLRNNGCYVRKITEFVIKCPEAANPYDLCSAIIKGSGFVYHQVRNMMMILFLIGMETEEISIIAELLDVEKNPAKPFYNLAEAYPLVLYSTTYDNLTWTISKAASDLLHDHLHRYWRNLATRTKLAQELLRSIENDTTIKIEDVDNQDEKSKFKANYHRVHSKFLNDGVKLNSKYKRVLDRPRGRTFEEMLTSMEEKRRRLNASNE
ncbi:tRNA pseudouridine(38/39) synthase-like [Clavelina lepadiformis]|uniref:tRNA pseudouridine(38/39) synthase-like n=1 Tax=Clavelina lepadiformis TaxID=159417 RepID=UPI00404130F3